jgi:hypothetical protein
MKEDSDDTMRKRRISLVDGRYLIFYTFDREDASSEANVGEQPPAPERLPQREENPRV